MTVALAKATRRQSKQRRQAAAAVTEREPQGGEDEHAVLIAIVIALLGDLSGGALAERLAGILVPFGFSPVAVVALMSVLGDQHTTFTPPGAEATEPALKAMERTEVTRRARYIFAAARRLQAGEPATAEKRLLGAHLAAERRRRAPGQQIDAAAAKYGNLLGWYAKKDRRTTSDCAAAHGSNFLATTPPAIGWPGTLHGGACRCHAGPPWSQAPLLP